MSDFSASTAVSSLLSVLRELPIWLLGGLALAGYTILFAPAFGNVNPAVFRSAWGIWIWIWALFFSTLTLTRSIEAGVTCYLVHRKTIEASQTLLFIPRNHPCWWHLAKQQDDSFVSQISLHIDVYNMTDRPVRIIKTELIRPRTKGEVLDGYVTMPMRGSPYNSREHAVSHHDTVTAHLHIMVRGTLAPQGKPIRATFQFTDQFGSEHRLNGIVIPSHDPRLPKLPWKLRLASLVRKLANIGRETRPEPDASLPLSPEWQHQGKFEEADLVLNEEKRSYAANGRICGGLGSLTTGIQSEPNSGLTKVGSVPQLLWDSNPAKPIESPNVARLIKFYATLDEMEQQNLAQYLLSHLHKKSPFADVTYFIFLALHRMGRTVDALQSARTYLAGDKVCGYSNLLGTLSALVSYEHLNINPDIYTQILEVLVGDKEDNFKLTEKINLARLKYLDSRLNEGGGKQA